MNLRFTWVVGTVRERLPGLVGNTKRFTTNVGADLVVSEFSDGYSLIWEGKCEFTVSLDGSEIHCVSESSLEFGWMLSVFYGMVLSYSLHLQGIPNVHAGSINTAHGAVGLMAASGTGKSTLTAALAACGYPFLTDDILAVTKSEAGYFAHPGYPTVSLTRESAAVVLNTKLMAQYEVEFEFDKARVAIDSRWAEFEYESVPLTALILLERGLGRTEITPERLSRVEATRVIVENTVCLSFLPKLSLDRYLKFAGELSAIVPVWKLPIPNNLDEIASTTVKFVDGIAAQADA